MQRKNGMKFSSDRKTFIDFQFDNLGEGWGVLKTSNASFARNNRFVRGP